MTRLTPYIGISIGLLTILYCLVGLLALAYTNRSVTRKDGAKLCNYITDVELVNKDLKIMKFWFEPDACYQVRFNAKV